ncbi:hypothetical protein NRK68_36055 (plasmid) [Streptomyces yangpuensis]|uniref:Uncharacterized protein n=1 Tax=Streptomyces yangpuensis TaxID=1648182 RepID=A0ABY5Q8V3_9ACTN|nr:MULTISPECIES: hypothetical protein [Streptomyces]MBZ9599537.1 hypothetical protein [Streptomyces erythrochromogenes]UUY52665.1 hypothetical protein NRK68_36055 [Streptomyces yangpuensis]
MRTEVQIFVADGPLPVLPRPGAGDPVRDIPWGRWHCHYGAERGEVASG